MPRYTSHLRARTRDDRSTSRYSNTRIAVGHGSACLIAVHPTGGGWLRLMREPWGHHTILLEIGGTVTAVAEADAAILGELVFAQLVLVEVAWNSRKAQEAIPELFHA